MSLPAPLARMWRQAGLDHLLLDEKRAAELRAARNTAAQAARTPGTRHAQTPPSALQRTEAAPARHEPQTRERAQGAPPETAPREIPQDVTPQNAAAKGAPVSWPAVWKDFFVNRTKNKRPAVVWTYDGLGHDMLGVGNPARQDMIRRMLQTLRHRTGTHGFWPYALPGDDSTGGDNPELFWAGIRALTPRYLIVFGQEAHAALGLEGEFVPFCEDKQRGRTVLLLPSALHLTEHDDAFGQTRAFLGSLLKKFDTPAS